MSVRSRIRSAAAGPCLALGLAAGCATDQVNPVEASGSPTGQTADLVLHHGKIVTVDEAIGEVQALAVLGDRIMAAGSNEAIQRYVGANTQVIDLQGRTAIPGFIEGHGHFTGVGEFVQNLNLMNIQNWDEAVDMVAAAVARAQPGEWIIGRGWHQEKWNRVPDGAVDGFPSHQSLSAVSPDNPVSLRHASGHASFFNAKAMELAGVDASTPDPSGGEIVRDAQGNPIGAFLETASGLVGRAQSRDLAARTPEQVEADLRVTIQLATQECLAKGVTTFQDAGSSLGTINTFKEMAEAGDLGIRLWVMIRSGNNQIADRLPDYKMIGVGDNHLTVRAIKRSIDGALGSRGAWLLEPYSDQGDSAGHNTSNIESIVETARLAAEHGFQLCVHAIGDRGNREVLDIFEATFAANPELQDLRWRVEHAQHINADDIPRFGQLGVVASMQGVHCTSDGPWVTPRLGAARAEEGAYVWQKLMKSGALVTNGTDAPVEDVNPILSFYATVSRRLADGTVFYPDQRMSRMEALQSYTINVAVAGFEEDIKGSLTPGKLADIVILSRDIMTIPEEEIPETVVVSTIVGGVVLYQRPEGN